MSDLRNKDWKVLKETLLYALLAGIALASYLLSWKSGSFLVFILFAFFTIQFSIDYLRKRNTDYLLIVGLPVFAIALFIILPFGGQYSLADLQMLSLIGSLLSLLVLGGFAHVLLRHNINKSFYPVLSAAVVGIGILLVYLVAPDLFDKIADKMALAFDPSGARLTIQEVAGLSVSTAWEYFGPAFYISLLSLIVLIYVVVKTGAPAKTLLVVWSLIVLFAAFGQQRLTYYLAVNVALLTAYLCYALFEILWANRFIIDILKAEPAAIEAEQKSVKKISGKEKGKLKKQARKQRQGLLSIKRLNATQVASAVLMVAVFCLIFYPNVSKAITLADNLRGPNLDWREALVWMKDNTPEPFENSDFFYGYFAEPDKEQNIVYPKPSYGVMSWWDYGYWITYIAHRVPNATPGNRGRENAAEFLLSRDETTANALLDSYGSRYIVLDLITASHSVTGIFSSVILWADEAVDDFFETYLIEEDGKLQQTICYYPAYYETMSTRLYFFKGKDVVPENTTLVISYVEKTDLRGVKYKMITQTQKFQTYEEAEDYLVQNGSENRRIVGNSPLQSPVPLKALENYELVFQSSTNVSKIEEKEIFKVVVFEYDSPLG
jgi:dolichyl-diphosphooligosaccharide--protein glycosyltransferase